MDGFESGESWREGGGRGLRRRETLAHCPSARTNHHTHMSCGPSAHATFRRAARA